MKTAPKKPASTARRAPARLSKTAQKRPLAAMLHSRPAAGGTDPLGSPGARGRRTSVNVFEVDLDALEPLRAFLRSETGLRVIRDSTLVQVACRVYQPGPAAVAALRAVLAADGRH